MSDLKAIIDATKKIEGILERDFSASGRGLHEKLSSARHIPEELAKRIRYIATIRNKAMHEEGFEIPDSDEFLKTCSQALTSLQQLVANPKPLRSITAGATVGAAHKHTSSSIWAVILGVFVGVVLVVLFLRTTASAPSNAAPTSGADRSSQMQLPSEVRDAPARTTTAQQRVKPANEAKSAANAKQSQNKAFAKSAAGDAPKELASLSGVKVEYGEGLFRRQEAKITTTVTNHTDKTISSLDVHARLYLDDDTKPFIDGKERLFAHFGKTGLRAGESREVTVTAGRSLGDEIWGAPDVVNATSRRVEIAAGAYRDGANNSHPFKGPWIGGKN